ncbi:MAG: hypothetical protein KGR98_10770, partial [Verrucomicrobia bacterium]|nr:hypothetical protein [Verrucomicrobiota bacterium]
DMTAKGATARVATMQDPFGEQKAMALEPELSFVPESGPSSELPRSCCGVELPWFWSEDGHARSFCRTCGQKFVDLDHVHYRQKPWIGVDLDGTLASDLGTWRGGAIGSPIAPMLARVKRWVAEGITVKVFTARASAPDQVVAIKKWLRRHGLPELQVTNVKDRLMIELWDDRCVQVRHNSGRPVNGSAISDRRHQSIRETRSSSWMAPVRLLSRLKILIT